MPSHQPASSAGNSDHGDTVTNAVLGELTRGEVSAFALERAPRWSDQSARTFMIWLTGVGRFCLTVRTGRHEMRQRSWYLDTGEGLRRTSSPLMQAWDEAVLASNEIHRHLGTWVMIAPAVYFSDTEPDALIWRVAERSGVAIIRRMDGFTRRLADIVGADPQLNPPSRRQAWAEMTALSNANAPPTGPP